MTTCTCICHSNGAYPPPCPTPGGCGPHETAESAHRCQRGSRCFAYERVETDGQQQKLGAVCDRPLCDTCERAVAQALEEVPDFYLQLGCLIVPELAGRPDRPHVSGSQGRPLPINTQALHLQQTVHQLLTEWEDIIRDAANLTIVSRRPFDRWGRTHRHGDPYDEVVAAAEVLSAHLTAWIVHAEVEYAVTQSTADPDDPKAEPSDESITVVQSGAQAAGALLNWRKAAQAAIEGPGQKPAARCWITVDGGAQCGGPIWVADHRGWCGDCGTRWDGVDFLRLAAVLHQQERGVA